MLIKVIRQLEQNGDYSRWLVASTLKKENIFSILLLLLSFLNIHSHTHTYTQYLYHSPFDELICREEYNLFHYLLQYLLFKVWCVYWRIFILIITTLISSRFIVRCKSIRHKWCASCTSCCRGRSRWVSSSIPR